MSNPPPPALSRQSLAPSSHLRNPSLGYHNLSSTIGYGSTTGQGNQAPSPALLKRIEEKKAELGQLKQLRDLSAGLAAQMEALQHRLERLGSGTEGELLLSLFLSFPFLSFFLRRGEVHSLGLFQACC
jgi:hypothetical protein